LPEIEVSAGQRPAACPYAEAKSITSIDGWKERPPHKRPSPAVLSRLSQDKSSGMDSKMSFGEAHGTQAPAAMAALVIPQRHRLRSKAERFVKEIYHREYGATLDGFPARMMAILDERGDILCAAGLRSCDDGFFSERYLDSPIEAALGRLRGEVVRRDRVFEISTFASRSPHSVPCFIGRVIEYGEDAGFEWGFFTLTNRLSLLLNRIGLELSPLGSATSARIDAPSSWGSYYETDPKVCAGNRDSLTTRFAARRRLVANA
jgi:hypothetical protein